MFTYPLNLQESKRELFDCLDDLKLQGYDVFLESFIIDKEYQIDKITINKTSRILNRVVLSSGLHGIEGYMGHVCQIYFLKNIIQTLDKHTSVILYHIINPYGMDHYRRFNRNNVDLNRNYSKSDFSTKNPEFLQVQKLLVPRKLSNKLFINTWFYSKVIGYYIRYGKKTLNQGILKGQKVDNESIYYSGKEYQASTKYMIDELEKIYQYVDHVVWIDIHTGYGKKYQMNVINSIYEKENTDKLISSIQYKDVMSYNAPLYETSGDITEKKYQVHNQNSYHSELLALCFEFGTTGNSLLSTLRSLKAILFENSAYHIKANEKINIYIRNLMKKTFLPDTYKWKTRQINNFDNALRDILKYKGLIQK